MSERSEAIINVSRLIRKFEMVYEQFVDQGWTEDERRIIDQRHRDLTEECIDAGLAKYIYAKFATNIKRIMERDNSVYERLQANNRAKIQFLTGAMQDHFRQAREIREQISPLWEIDNNLSLAIQSRPRPAEGESK